jgi:hypothetical protein
MRNYIGSVAGDESRLVGASPTFSVLTARYLNIYLGMKSCGHCEKLLSYFYFNKDASSKDGFQSLCKECSNKFKRQHYKRNKKKYQQKRDEKRKATRAHVNKLKEEHACKDCSFFYPYYIMQFDHIEEKTQDISTMIRKNKNLDQILEEIKKCELVCANCHSIRGFQRGYAKKISAISNTPSAIRARKVRKSNRELVKNLKEKSPCVDCNIQYPYYVMAYDHLRDKKFKINVGMSTQSQQALLLEIEKCELVCHNCHAERTFQRNNS